MRTYPMRAFTVANAVELAVFVYFFVAFVLPAASGPSAAFVIPFVAFMALFAAVAAAAWRWSRAPVSGRFWLLAAIPAIVVLLAFAPQLVYELGHPANVIGFIPSAVTLAASLGVIASAVLARRDARLLAVHGTVPAESAARVVTVAALAALTGAITTSVLASAGPSAGTAVAEAGASTVAAVAGTSWATPELDIAAGGTTAIVVTNHDPIGHAFDIDALNIHATLPPNSTSLVAVTPATAGRFEFYCSVPGHRATMTGTLTVH